jgi:hypothetical protein
MSEEKNKKKSGNTGIDFLVDKSPNVQQIILDLKSVCTMSVTGITNFVVNHENPILVEYILRRTFKTKQLFNGTVKMDAVEVQHGRPGKGASVRYFDELIYGTYKTKTGENGEPVPDMNEQTGEIIREENGLVTRSGLREKPDDGGCEDRILLIKNLDYSLDWCKPDEPGKVDTRALFLLDKFRHPMNRWGCALVIVTNKKLDLPFPVNTVEMPTVSDFEVKHILNRYIRLYRDKNTKLILSETEINQIVRKLTGLTYNESCDTLGYCFLRSVRSNEEGEKFMDMAEVLKLLRTKINKDLMDNGFGLTQLDARPWEDYICPVQSNFTHDVNKLLRDFNEVDLLDSERKNIAEDLKSKKNDKNSSKFQEGLDSIDKVEREIENLRTRMPHIMVLHGQGGVGKCLGRGTKVIMFDGSTKNVEDIEVGETLMGPDSAPRKVLSTTYGIGPLYKVSQKNGKDYICNDKHILSLQKEGTSNNGKEVFISVEEYMGKSKTWKKTHYGWKSGVNFPKRNLPIDPYWMGLWLGDGNSVKSAIIVGDKDPEIKKWLKKWAKKNKCFIRAEEGRGAETLNFSFRVGSGYAINPIINSLRELNVYGSKCKHIPDLYLKNSSKNRLKLLAGLIDSDGYMTKTGTLQFTNTNKELALNTLNLVRSLGFKGFWSESVKTLKELDYSVNAYTISIGGDLSRIPTKLKRKKGHDSPQKKALKCGISVAPIGEGEYFGFTIDGDHQFLLEDFTVTHNSAFPIHLAGLLDMDVWDFNINATHSKWIGQGSEQMRESLEKISATSHIIIRIDEYDRAMGSTNERGGGMHEAHKQVESEFMNWLQNTQEDNLFVKRNIFVVMTTNHVDNITGPMLRSGRADLVIDIGSFDADSMMRTFSSCARRMYNRGITVSGFETQEALQAAIDQLDLAKLSEIAMVKKFTVRDVEMLIIEMGAYKYYFEKYGDERGIPWTTESFVKILENSEGSVKGATTGELKLGDRDYYKEDAEDIQVEFEDSVSDVEKLKETKGFQEEE